MNRSAIHALPHMAVAIAMSVGLAVAARQVPAQPRNAMEPSSVAELEAAFWRCDLLATQSLVDPATAALCSKSIEELRAVKFGGDFNEMLAWWQQRKVAGRQEAAAPATEAASALEARVHGLPVDQLRRLYLGCARVSEERRLSSEEVVVCSIGSNALLTRAFGGDFDALLAWSRHALTTETGVAQRGR